jgi:hypothetical protein
MISLKLRQAVPLYKSIMEEIKIRVEIANNVLLAPPPLPETVVREFCSLQIRFVCELIALGCLVAHGDINKSNKLTKYYQADRIMHSLEELNPEFFPRPVIERIEGPHCLHYEFKTSGYLNKSDFLRVYNQTCGKALHRGSLKHLLSPRHQEKAPLIEIRGLISKIRELLNPHVILLHDQSTVLLCSMSVKGTGEVAVHLADALEQTPHDR